MGIAVHQDSLATEKSKLNFKLRNVINIWINCKVQVILKYYKNIFSSYTETQSVLGLVCGTLRFQNLHLKMLASTSCSRNCGMVMRSHRPHMNTADEN